MWIGSSCYGPHTATFVPPHHKRVPAAIEHLVESIRRDDLAVLPHAALAHAQFETIHPFPDGNGRTGRAIVHCLLRDKRLTRQVTVPVSAGLLTDTDQYFDALTARSGGSAERLDTTEIPSDSRWSTEVPDGGTILPSIPCMFPGR